MAEGRSSVVWTTLTAPGAHEAPVHPSLRGGAGGENGRPERPASLFA